MAYLDDHPPARRQFYCPRRDGTQPSGVIVVHDAENATDTSGSDIGAEAVARFIQTRDTPGSYHDLADSDSIINLVRYECEAFHDATGTNRHSYGVSGAYRHSDWLSLPQARRDGFVRNMATAARRYADWLHARRGIVIPARRISETQARNRVPGFISHAELDPARRTDPGPHFPWDQFLAAFAPVPPQEDDDMAYFTIYTGPGMATRLSVDGSIVTAPAGELNEMVAAYKKAGYKEHRVAFPEADDYARFVHGHPTQAIDNAT